MRTTITIDDDLLDAARELAKYKRVSIGKVISDLVRKGLSAGNSVQRQRGEFPVFQQPPDARPITLETVKQAEEDEY